MNRWKLERFGSYYRTKLNDLELSVPFYRDVSRLARGTSFLAYRATTITYNNDNSPRISYLNLPFELTANGASYSVIIRSYNLAHPR